MRSWQLAMSKSAALPVLLAFHLQSCVAGFEVAEVQSHGEILHSYQDHSLAHRRSNDHAGNAGSSRHLALSIESPEHDLSSLPQEAGPSKQEVLNSKVGLRSDRKTVHEDHSLKSNERRGASLIRAEVGHEQNKTMVASASEVLVSGRTQLLNTTIPLPRETLQTTKISQKVFNSTSTQMKANETAAQMNSSASSVTKDTNVSTVSNASYDASTSDRMPWAVQVVAHVLFIFLLIYAYGRCAVCTSADEHPAILREALKSGLRNPRDEFRKPFRLWLCAGWCHLLWISLVLGALWRLLSVLAAPLLEERAALAAACYLPALYLAYLRWSYCGWAASFSTMVFWWPESDSTSSAAPLEGRTARLPQNVAKDLGTTTTIMTMRPTRISLSDYLWCMHAIYPFFAPVTCAKIIYYRQLLNRASSGRLKRRSTDDLLACLMLNTAASLWFRKIVNVSPFDGRGGGKFAIFDSTWFGPLRFPGTRGPGHQVYISKLEIVVDLDAKLAIGATVDGKSCPIEEAHLFIMYQLTWHGHAWLRAYAGTWGTNQFDSNSWLARMSICSLFFNHLHGDGAGSVWTREVAGDPALDACNELPFQVPMRALDSACEPLRPWSRAADFLLRGWDVWQRLHRESEDGFSQDIDAHYRCTVMHSVDHWLLAHVYTADENAMASLVLSNSTGEIDHMKAADHTLTGLAQIGDWPRTFNVYFRRCSHPLYTRFYQEMAEVDPELAWHLKAAMVG